MYRSIKCVCVCVCYIHILPIDLPKFVDGNQLELPWNVLANPSPHATRAARARRGERGR